jgi:hypothetical protein
MDFLGPILAIGVVNDCCDLAKELFLGKAGGGLGGVADCGGLALGEGAKKDCGIEGRFSGCTGCTGGLLKTGRIPSSSSENS